jgi:hypothetical protein
MGTSTLERDLDNLMWFDRGTAPFTKALTPMEWNELDDWCDSNFGVNNWFIEKNKIHTRKPEHLTLFLLRWL